MVDTQLLLRLRQLSFYEVRMYPYVHPLHQNFCKQLIYISYRSLIHSKVVPGLNHVIVVWFVSSCYSDSVSSAHLQVFDEVRMHPYDHPLHQKVLKHCIYIEDGSVIHSEVVSGSTMA